MTSLHRTAIAAALLMVATVAGAAIRAASHHPANFTFASPTVFVPLNPSGGTTVNFTLPAAGRKVLTFSAECAVDAPAGNQTAWVDLDILVNGAVVPPTVGTADAFCAANGTAGFDAWARHSITVTFQGRAGSNSLRVLARLNAGATGGWISDISWVIHD